MPLPLITDRLILRPFREADLPAFVAYRSDPEVARYQSWDAPYPQDEADRFLDWANHRLPPEHGWHQLAIELRETGETVGDVAFCLLPDEAKSEIGFTLARDFQRRGYAAEAVGRLLSYLRHECEIAVVRANCDTRNARSARLLWRLGFTQDGPPRRVAFKGEWCEEQWHLKQLVAG